MLRFITKLGNILWCKHMQTYYMNLSSTVININLIFKQVIRKSQNIHTKQRKEIYCNEAHLNPAWCDIESENKKFKQSNFQAEIIE